MSAMVFDNWMSLIRTLVIGSLSYIGLVVFLRVSGKRTLSKLNMFDFIVTVAFGSTLATVILSKDVSLIQGLAGLGLLVFLQYVITFVEVRSSIFKDFIKSSPTLLYFDDIFLFHLMKKERVTKEEIHAVLRQKGYGSAKSVKAIIMETDGTFSVISDQEEMTLEKLRDDGVLVE